MERVLVIDKNQQPLMPCRMNRVRLIIKPEKVVIFRYHNNRHIEYQQGELFRRLKDKRLPVETNTGGLIEFRICRQTLEKNHWLDARNIGKSPPVKLQITGIKPLLTERTAIAMLPGPSPQQFYHLERPPYQTASPMPATTKLSTAMVDVSMGEER